MSGLRVALLYNLKTNRATPLDGPADALAEYDSAETVVAIAEALRSAGHEVVSLEADETLPDTIRATAPDVCFNIAEGLRGDARESQVPALLEMLGIPYTGSKVLTHALSLDKVVAKRLWRDAGLPTAPFQVFHRGDEVIDRALRFPLFVKPAREGSGMGVTARSVVHDVDELREQVRWVVETYRQPALVEEYLPGREFTVGLIGNPWQAKDRRTHRELYDEWGYHVLPVLEIDASIGADGGQYGAVTKSFVPGEEGAPGYICPAPIEPALVSELKMLTIAAFETLGGLDVARVDFRLSDEGRPSIIEINTLPGLNPVVSDLCIMARAEGMPYATLITAILDLALARTQRVPARIMVPR